MPPARPRAALDDSRSESSSTIATLKERANNTSGGSKSKKNASGAHVDASSTFKTAAVNGALAVSGGAIPLDGPQAAPQTDWSSISVSTLHTYRAAYRIQTPPSYVHPHADLIFNSSEIGLRSPSQVLARRKARDLKTYRRKIVQLSNGRHGHIGNGTTNGTTNGAYKASKSKQKDRMADNDASSETSSQRSRKRRKETHQAENNGLKVDAHDTNRPSNSIAQSIEPPSPTIQSQRSGDFNSNSISHSQSDQNQHHPPQAQATASEDSIPSSLLDAADPESTIIGTQSHTNLATIIRKHFNAQQLNEMDTLARFSYVAKQSGYGFVGAHSVPASLLSSVTGSSNLKDAKEKADKDGDPFVNGHNNVRSHPRENGYSINGMSVSTDGKHKASQPIHVEGSDGDGTGWIMGSMGRQVRMSDMSGGGTFRLRFRPS